MKGSSSALAVLLFATACGGSNPLRETALGIAAASAVARSVQLGMDSIPGTHVDACVQVTQGCTSYPCDGAATVTLGGGCPLPLGAHAAGTIAVTGHFSSATQSTFTTTFTNVTVGAMPKAVALANVTAITGTLSGNTLKVTYAGETARARSGVDAASVGGASSWTVNVDTKGTPDLGDDVLTIDASSASGAAGLGTAAKAATLTGVVVDPSCAANPVGGSGQITEVSTFIPKIENLAFHAACDGTGTVNGHAYPFDVSP
jgi:hypothetical protein